MASGNREATTLRDRVFSPVAIGVVLLSLVLTASFIGMLGLLSSEVTLDVGSRLPAYVLLMGIVFVAGIVRLDSADREGVRVLVAVSSISLLAFVLAALATEGVVYTIRRPDAVIRSHLILNIGAAGLICTGVVIWALHHWREFATTTTSTGRSTNTFRSR